jgi:hypothetical protein
MTLLYLGCAAKADLKNPKEWRKSPAGQIGSFMVLRYDDQRAVRVPGTMALQYICSPLQVLNVIVRVFTMLIYLNGAHLACQPSMM